MLINDEKLSLEENEPRGGPVPVASFRAACEKRKGGPWPRTNVRGGMHDRSAPHYNSLSSEAVEADKEKHLRVDVGGVGKMRLRKLDACCWI